MPTLVFVCGLLSDQRVWASTMQACTEYPQVLADNQSDDTITGMARRALTATEGEIIPIGHSMGGRVALEMARLAPGRVKALVLANTGHAGQKPGELAQRQAKIDLGHKDMSALAAEWIPPMLAAGREADSDLLNSLTSMVLASGPTMHERQIMALVNRPNATAYLSEIKAPTLLLTGAQDRWSSVAQHQEIENMMPKANLVIVEDAGHFMPVEQPVETARSISAWLASNATVPNGS